MKTTLLLAITISAVSALAEPTTFSSTIAQTDLIELYTSEGCRSCPPAERRLNDFAHHKGLWSEFVPIAFHVDYWNYLGWPDRFSSKAFTSRQRSYSKHWKSSTIYTPCFVVNGKPTRNPRASKSSDQPGTLKATIAAGKIHVVFIPEKTDTKDLTVWVSPVSGDVSSNVTSGENRGRKLVHCFIALGLEQKTMTESGTIHTATLATPIHPGTKGLAVWVTNSNSMEPIQATGGWLK